MNAARKYSIAWKGLSEGEHTFDFEAGDDLFRLFENTEIKRRALRREGESFTGGTSASPRDFDPGQRSGGVRSLSGRLFRSDRLRRELLVKFSDEVREYDGDTLWLSPSEDFVDLTQYIYESIVLSLPISGCTRRGVRSGYVGTLPHRFPSRSSKRSRTKRNSGKERPRAPDNGPNN